MEGGKFMRILIYNWARLDETNTCGGVSVYTRNIVSSLLKDEKYDIYFLNSGFSYTLDGKLKIKKSQNLFGEKVCSYEIFNSPVIAPVQQSIKNTKKYLQDQTLYNLIKAWMKNIGPFDVIHFQNLEGLSLSVLRLKEDFPNTKFIYSVHNYFPLCTAVNLWNIDHNCEYGNFSNCEHCFCRRRYRSAKLLRIFGNFRLLEGSTYYLSKYYPDEDSPNLYEQFYSENKKFINQYIDQILAVSERVKAILVRNGYDEDKIQTSYIGTKVAENQVSPNISIECSDPFKIIYMGYMLNFKGYHFFINALKKIPLDMAKNIHVTICARHSKVFQKMELDDLEHIKDHFYKIDLFNGYDATSQREYLQGQHLGVVPVLWEDNLPQVLIEQIAYGVPVLCSDLGGGKEIVNNPDFVFEAGNEQDFINKFCSIYSNRAKLSTFWEKVKKLTTLDEHIHSLDAIYCSK